jgi:hypothetical protein
MNFIHSCQNFIIWQAVLLETWHVLHFCTDGFPRVSRVRRWRFDPTNSLHWEAFRRLAWEALSAAGYPTPLTYEVSDFERLGVPRCRVIVTVLPHPDHADWFDLSFVYWGFITHETVESAALWVLMDFYDHNPTMVALSPFGLFPAVSPHDPTWLDRMDHLRELLLLAEPLDVTQTLAHCLNVVFTLQGLRYNMLTVYFSTPSMLITLWFGFDYGTNLPLGTLII